MSACGVLRIFEGNLLAFWCPACHCAHSVRAYPDPHAWTFNGNYEKPTFSPSVLVTRRVFTEAGKAAYERWSNAGHPPLPGSTEQPFATREERCHSFVRDGMIQFLADCTHELSGQTVPLEPF